jgi:hypothetical protein
MKKIVFKESEIRNIIRKLIQEQSMENIKKDSKPKARCLPENTMNLDSIVGNREDFKNYAYNVNRRIGGISGMIDALDILKTLRLHPYIKDNGENISYELLTHLNQFQNKNYFDEVTSNCQPSMEKVIELYKENEHGEELVKDIEKVLAHSGPSPKAKEYLKRCLELVKSKPNNIS